MEKSIEKEIQQIFPLEFINRLDTVHFRPLKIKDIVEIARNLLEQLREERLQAKGISFQIDDQGIELICRKGYDELYGARHLKRTIEDMIVGPVSDKLLLGKLQPGDTLYITATDDELQFSGNPKIMPHDSDGTKKFKDGKRR